MTLGQRLKARREELGCGIRQLGRETGIAAQTIINIENSVSSPLFKNVIILSKTLSIPLDELAALVHNK